MTDTSALVSVVIPVYGVERFVAATVRSVLAQTYPHFEVWIVDDESPDRSIEICRQFDDPRLHIIHQCNRGLAGARNAGIRHCRGQYVAFLDSDDIWLPQKLEKHVAHLERSAQVGVSYCPSEFIDEAGNPLGIYQTPALTNISAGQVLCRNPVGNGSVPVLRRKVLEAIAFPDSRYGAEATCYFDETFRESEDVECWTRIAVLTDWRFEGIPDVLTQYRVNLGGLSANLRKKQRSWEQMLAKVASYAPEFAETYIPPCRAYHLRFLARRAVTLRDGGQALQ
ncbi:MAG: glycosyltransferase, partial [Cyanobacteria bacterium J06648_11]